KSVARSLRVVVAGAAANARLPVGRQAVGEADARREVRYAVVSGRVRAAGIAAHRQARGRVLELRRFDAGLEASHTAELFLERKERLPAQPKVQRQALVHAPVVLRIGGPARPRHICKLAASLRELRDASDQEVSQVIAAEAVGEGDETAHAVCVEEVLL